MSTRKMTPSWRRLLALLLLCAVVLPATASVGSVLAKKIVVKGRVTAVDTGRPIAGATVKIDGVGKAKTNKSGRFVIRSHDAPAGTASVTIRARGHVVRQTSIVVPAPGGKARENWNLLPKKGEQFDLDLFNFVARPAGVVRWETPPVIRILLNRLECREPTNLDTGDCREWFATTKAIDSTVLEWLRRAAEVLTPLVAGPSGTYTVEEVQLAPGQTIDRATLLRPGTYTVGEVDGLSAMMRFPSIYPGSNGAAAIESLVRLRDHGNPSSDETALRRLVARGLGYYGVGSPDLECDQAAARGLFSFFCPEQGIAAPTSLDAAMARAIYSRPIGNQSPDRDPE